MLGFKANLYIKKYGMTSTENFNKPKLVKEEIIDINNLNLLLNSDKIDFIQKTFLKKILQNKTNGNKLKTNYNYGRSIRKFQIGRLYSDIGLQGIERNVRALLAQNNYFDLDIVNCHPVLLLDN